MSLVGSTGSIGTQAVDVVDAEPAGSGWWPSGPTSVDALAAQAQRLRPEMVALGDPSRRSWPAAPAGTGW